MNLSQKLDAMGIDHRTLGHDGAFHAALDELAQARATIKATQDAEEERARDAAGDALDRDQYR